MKIFKGLALTLILALCIASYAAEKVKPHGFGYLQDGQMYFISFIPHDKTTQDLIKKYKIVSTDTSLGGTVYALDRDKANADGVKVIFYGDKILVRAGFTKYTNAQFIELLKDGETKFNDLSGASDFYWDSVKAGLHRGDWAKPILKDGEVLEGEFLLHNCIIEYWKK